MSNDQLEINKVQAKASEKNTLRINLNIVITMAMGSLICYIGKSQLDQGNKNTEELSKIIVQLPYIQESVKGLESKMDTVVTRSELDSRLQLMEQQHRESMKQIQDENKKPQ